MTPLASDACRQGTRLTLVALTVFIAMTLSPTPAFATNLDFVKMWGSQGSAEGQFRGPGGLGVNSSSGDVYVADVGNARIQRFSATGAFLGAWGHRGSGEGEFRRPAEVAVNSATGVVYVTDEDNHRVQAFNPTGRFLGSWGQEGSAPGQFRWPAGIDVNSASGEVYVADHDRVQRFSAAGAFLGTWGSEGVGEGQFKWPDAVAVNSSSSEVYVADTGNHRIQRFSATGDFLGKWGRRGSQNGRFTNLTGIAVNSSSGVVYATDSESFEYDRVQWFRATGDFLGKWDTWGRGPGQFDNPGAIVANPSSGRVYVFDNFNHRVQMFRTTQERRRVRAVIASCRGRNWGILRPRPRRINLNCYQTNRGAGRYLLRNLRWRQWGNRRARTRGRLVMRGCLRGGCPAEGRIRVRVTVYRLGPPFYARGRWNRRYTMLRYKPLTRGWRGSNSAMLQQPSSW